MLGTVSDEAEDVDHLLACAINPKTYEAVPLGQLRNAIRSLGQPCWMDCVQALSDLGFHPDLTSRALALVGTRN